MSRRNSALQRWVGLCREFETRQRGGRRAGTEQIVTSIRLQPRGMARRGARVTNSNRSHEEGKRLYQRIVAKLNYFAHDRLDLKYATSCLASAVSSPSIGDMRAAKRVGRYLRIAPVAWQGFPFHDPRPEELLCHTDTDSGFGQDFSKVESGGVVTLGGGVLNCWAKKQKSVALSSWESELFAAITSGTRSFGIQSELMDLGNNCSVTVATDSQSVIDHSRRRSHSVAPKHVGLRGLWLLENRKLELEKVDTATNPGDVCTKACIDNLTSEELPWPRSPQSS